MSYEKQTWVNRDLSKPLNDGRMNHIEDGIFEAAATADAAQVAANLDADTATLVGDVETATGAALAATIARRSLDVVADFGAVGDGSTDDTAAIQAAIDAAVPGQAIVFPQTGSSDFYKITDTLLITTPNVRLVGQPRDGYAVSIRCAVASKTMLVVKTTGVVLQDIAFIGDGSTNGTGATVKGIDLYGDIEGNVDALISGCTFQFLAVSALTRGRNATFNRDTLVSNSLVGFVFDGPDAVYHTGSTASENRGNTVRGCRFHNVGAATTDAAIRVTVATVMLHGIFDQNFFDSNGLGRHIEAIGSSSVFLQGISMVGNKHTELRSNAYYLQYVANSSVSDAEIIGYTVAGQMSGNGVMLDHCQNVMVDNVNLYQIGLAAIHFRSNSDCIVRNVKARNVGIASTSHGVDADGTNALCGFENIEIYSVSGSGFYGNPNTNCWLVNFHAPSFTERVLNSTTLTNRASYGRNQFIEGRDGRIEDYAAKPFDLTVAAGATDIATVLGGSAYSSFMVDVEIVGRNSAGPVYARYIRYVRPENGSPVYVTPVTDVITSGQISVAFVTSGTTGVKVTATVTTNDAFITAHVRARSGGGATSANGRNVTVTMA
jgi:hypothetical protein